MKIIMGAATRGFALKNAIKAHLTQQGHEVIDVGCFDTQCFTKYTSVGERVAKALQDGLAPLAIACCGSGTGVSLSANKFKGVLACSCESVATAQKLRSVNGGNCLCLGEMIVPPELGCQMADAFVATRFEQPEFTPAMQAFWREAHEEMLRRGDLAGDRSLETVP